MKNYRNLIIAGITSLVLFSNSYCMQEEKPLRLEQIIAMITNSKNFYHNNSDKFKTLINDDLVQTVQPSITHLNISNSTITDTQQLPLKVFRNDKKILALQE